VEKTPLVVDETKTRAKKKGCPTLGFKGEKKKKEGQETGGQQAHQRLAYSQVKKNLGKKKDHVKVHRNWLGWKRQGGKHPDETHSDHPYQEKMRTHRMAETDLEEKLEGWYHGSQKRPQKG